jgi:hypothetical protein
MNQLICSCLRQSLAFLAVERGQDLEAASSWSSWSSGEAAALKRRAAAAVRRAMEKAMGRRRAEEQGRDSDCYYAL